MYLRVRPGTLEDVITQLRGATGVRAAVAVVGDWDILAAVSGPDLVGIAESVIRTIHRIDGVERTVTSPVVPGDVLGMVAGIGSPVPMQRGGEACFVHIRAESGHAARLVEALGELEQVSAVALIAGEYDLIAEIPLSWEQAARVIVDDILPLPGVAATRTLVGVPDLEPQDDERDQFSSWS